jgi:hypothetical protein
MRPHIPRPVHPCVVIGRPGGYDQLFGSRELPITWMEINSLRNTTVGKFLPHGCNVVYVDQVEHARLVTERGCIMEV